MKFEKRKLATLIILAVTLVSLGTVYAIPKMPHQFYGAVTVDGVAAPDGTVVEAKIGGIVYEESTTSGGLYGWSPVFQVPADDTDTGTVEGGVDGESVSFYVGGVLASSSVVFSSGAVAELDLAVTGSAVMYEIPLVEGWNLVGVPFIPTDTSIEVMLSGVLSYVSSVKTYDGATGWWYTYSPGRPSNLQTIEDGKGYWIQMTADAVWEIDIS